ncbi:MAG: hypothetical protein H6624_16245 [Bdellovibrionaceae bacterium]|nr:hypothetical protein [Bdellovibrionales bacterium]MCB9085899.1 hypothetical protein [Pseudobdellovibrionaceae bacterium]
MANAVKTTLCLIITAISGITALAWVPEDQGPLLFHQDPHTVVFGLQSLKPTDLPSPSEQEQYLADDFDVPKGEIWDVRGLTFYTTGYLDGDSEKFRGEEVLITLFRDQDGQPGDIIHQQRSLVPEFQITMRSFGFPVEALYFAMDRQVHLREGKYWVSQILSAHLKNEDDPSIEYFTSWFVALFNYNESAKVMVPYATDPACHEWNSIAKSTPCTMIPWDSSLAFTVHGIRGN